MKYRLVLLTHGEHRQTVERTLRSFHEHVTPKPWDYVCIRDGGGVLPPINPDGQTWRGAVLQPQQGFCAATRAAWRAAVLPGIDYVFWLEHDFLFTRDVDMRHLGQVLEDAPTVCQVALLRKDVNRAERRSGGLAATTEGEVQVRPNGVVWTRHSAYYTTNPNLMRRAFMTDNTWPDEEGECEGKFGLTLKEKGYDFAFMGDGSEPWVEHVGVRDGFGY